MRRKRYLLTEFAPQIYLKMLKIKTINLRALENDRHFSLMESGITLFSAVETENEQYKSIFEAWKQAFEKEDNVMYLLRKSMELQDVNEQHKVRCNCLSALMGIVHQHANCPHSPSHAIAQRLYVHLHNARLYKHAGIDKMSSCIHHIIEIINQDEFKALITTLAVQDIYDQMQKAQEEVLKNQSLRDNADVEKQLGKAALYNARQATDEAYRKFTKCMEAMMMMFPGTIEDTVEKWNRRVVRYRNVMELKQAMAAARKKAEQEGELTTPEDNKPASGENKPSTQPDGPTSGQNHPSTGDKPSTENNQPAGGNKPTEGYKPTEGNHATEDKPSSEGNSNKPTEQDKTPTDDNTSTNGNSSDPIYTPVNPESEVGTHAK